MKDRFVFFRPIIQISGSCSCLISGYSRDLQMSSQSVVWSVWQGNSMILNHWLSDSFWLLGMVFWWVSWDVSTNKNSWRTALIMSWSFFGPGQLCHLDQCLCWGWSCGVGINQQRLESRLDILITRRSSVLRAYLSLPKLDISGMYNSVYIYTWYIISRIFVYTWTTSKFFRFFQSVIELRAEPKYKLKGWILVGQRFIGQSPKGP